MELLKGSAGVICSILYKDKAFTLRDEDYYSLPFFTPEDFKRVYFILPVENESVLFTKDGIYRNAAKPGSLIQKVLERSYTKTLELGLHSLYGKKCLKPYFHIGQCMQPLFRFRDNPPFLNLCNMTQVVEGDGTLHLSFDDYSLVLNYSKKSFDKKLAHGMSLVKSCHLYFYQMISKKSEKLHLFNEYNYFIRKYLLMSDATAHIFEELLKRGTIRYLTYEEWINYNKKFFFED